MQRFFKGTIANFNTNMNIVSSFGNAKSKLHSTKKKNYENTMPKQTQQL
jgi:hypothetical protein